MPYTPTNYPWLKHFNQNNGIWGLMRWLLNDQTTVAPNGPVAGSFTDPVVNPGPAGPGWKLVECRSNGGRYQPGTPESGNGTLSGISDTSEGVAYNWRYGATFAINFVTVSGASASAGDTITIGGTVLTAVSGARTPGSNDFDVSSGNTAIIVADIVAAINDPQNSFTSIATAADNSPVVELTAVTEGPTGNSVTLATSNATAFALESSTFFGVLEDGDWIVLESDRVSVHGATAQATGSITPDTWSGPITITIHGIVLVGASGPRTSGSDDFDQSLGTVAELVTEITEAINDPANSFSDIVTASDNTTHVGLAGDEDGFPGVSGNLITLAAESPYTVSGPYLTGGNSGEEFQVLFSVGTGNEILGQLMIPFANWTASSSNVPASTLTPPADSFGDGLAAIKETSIQDPTFHIAAVADEGMLALIWDPNLDSRCRFQYYGDLDNPHPFDLRPFVFRNREGADRSTNIHWAQYSFAFYWDRISPVDNSTLVVGHEQTGWTNGSANVHVLERSGFWGSFSRLGTNVFFPVSVIFTLAGHLHHAGFLRNVYQGDNSLGRIGTSGGHSHMFRTDDIGTDNRSPIVLKWDGITPV